MQTSGSMVRRHSQPSSHQPVRRPPKKSVVAPRFSAAMHSGIRYSMCRDPPCAAAPARIIASPMGSGAPSAEMKRSPATEAYPCAMIHAAIDTAHNPGGGILTECGMRKLSRNDACESLAGERLSQQISTVTTQRAGQTASAAPARGCWQSPSPSANGRPVRPSAADCRRILVDHAALCRQRRQPPSPEMRAPPRSLGSRG